MSTRGGFLQKHMKFKHQGQSLDQVLVGTGSFRRGGAARLQPGSISMLVFLINCLKEMSEERVLNHQESSYCDFFSHSKLILPVTSNFVFVISVPKLYRRNDRKTWICPCLESCLSGRWCVGPLGIVGLLCLARPCRQRGCLKIWSCVKSFSSDLLVPAPGALRKTAIPIKDSRWL